MHRIHTILIKRKHHTNNKQPNKREIRGILPWRLGESIAEKSIHRTTCGLSVTAVVTGRSFVTVAVSMFSVPHGIVSTPGTWSPDPPLFMTTVASNRPVSFVGVIAWAVDARSDWRCSDERSTLLSDMLFRCAVNGCTDLGVVTAPAVVTGLRCDRGVTGVHAGVVHLSDAKPLA